MSRSTSLFLLPLFTILALSCGGTSPPASTEHDLLNQAPEPATRPTLGGQMVEIPVKGKVTVLDFWATYCEPCLAEMPELEAWWRNADHGQVQLVGIAADDDDYAVRQKLDELGITFPQLIDDAFVLKGRYLVRSLPAAFVLDRSGRIRYYASADNYRAADLIRAAESLM